MQLFKNIRPFVIHRLMLISLLWSSILALAVALPAMVELVSDKRVEVGANLAKFADPKLVALLIFGALIANGVMSLVTTRLPPVSGDAEKQAKASSALWDEVSSAATHFALADFVAILLDGSAKHSKWEFAWIMCFVALGWLFYSPERHDKTPVAGGSDSSTGNKRSDPPNEQVVALLANAQDEEPAAGRPEPVVPSTSSATSS